MEGQAVSDWEKSPVTCTDWCKFWFSRKTTRARTKEEEWEGQGLVFLLWVHSWSVQVLPWDQQSCHHPRIEMLVCWISVSAAGQRGSALPAWHTGTADMTPGLPWEQWEWQSPACAPWGPRTGTFLKCIANLHSGQTHWLPEKSCLPGALAALCL